MITVILGIGAGVAIYCLTFRRSRLEAAIITILILAIVVYGTARKYW